MDMFSALADPNRREIIELLAKNGQLSSSAISAKFSVSAPAISQHLKVLKEAKIVNVEKRAQQRIYTINTQTIHQVEEWARKMEEMWNARFDRLEQVLEIEKRKLKKHA